jgi:hypothetical protein
MWRPHLGFAENTEIAGRCKAGASNHFGEEFDEQEDCRLWSTGLNVLREGEGVSFTEQD